MTKTTQVFIVGMNGSGTTMLLDCLAGHSMLYGFRGETKILPYFIGRQSSYGDLADDVNFKRLWQDLRSAIGGRGWRAGVTSSQPEEWGGRPRSVAEIFDSVMASLAAAEGKRIWCEKTPMYVHHIETLAREFPGAKFVHVIRDGRDCAASFHRRWRFSPVRTMFRWKRAVEAGRRQGAAVGSRYCEIRYEQLTAMPEKSLQDLCQFIGVPFESSILKPARLRPQMTGSSATAIAINDRRAEQYFRPAQMQKLERVAGKQLAACGYITGQPDGDEDPPRWMLVWWEFVDDLRRFRDTFRTALEMRKSRRLAYLSRRVLSALRQKKSLK